MAALQHAKAAVEAAEAGDDWGSVGGGSGAVSASRRRLLRLETAPRHASKRFLLAHQLVEAKGAPS